jgi:ATP-dependent protease ClpP protease subunit
MPNAPLNAQDFRSPAVTVSGTVDYNMYKDFRAQLDKAEERKLVVVELSTLGKAAIYSAGTTFMSFFARDNRYVTRGSRLMVHERKLSKTLTIDGPLTTCLATVQATLNEIECSIAIQNEGFENLVRGSQVTIQEVLEKAPSNWYVEAEEAKRLGLIEAVL